MKIVNCDKNYSWLQWRVKLKNCSDPKLHLTVKFFGDAEIDPDGVHDVICGITELKKYSKGFCPQFIKWSPEIFSDLVYVLRFIECPYLIENTHRAFGIIKDQFNPWKPHITVPKSYWDNVIKNNWTPHSEQLYFGELELFLKKEN